MIRKLRAILLTAAFLLCTACTPFSAEQSGPAPVRLPEGQSLQQLHLEQQERRLCGAWIPYYTCERLFSAESNAVCKTNVMNYLSELQKFGVNAVFVHICAFGESTYPSAYYPTLPAARGHDEMQVFTDVCNALGIALHAWINPLRLQTDEYMAEQRGNALLNQWYRDPAQRSKNLTLWGGRYYLNPAAPSTAELLTAAITEVMDNYHPAGIHIDDYFYPTTAAAFDFADFTASGSTDLAAWRRENITKLIKKMNAAVHQSDVNAVFSISPQGNLAKDYNTLYADAAAWCEAGDCCDLLIPQVYFGYRNELNPFAETVEEWAMLPRADNVRLAIGLAAYKVGEEDAYAGDGQNEWITEHGLLARETAEILRMPALCGCVWYHGDALNALNAKERDALIRVVNEQ